MKLIKNLPLMAFVIGLGLIVGMSAFKGERSDNIAKRAETTEWYAITVTAPASDPDNQTVTGLTADPQPATDPSLCALQNSGQYCSVQISYDETVDPDDFEGKTVTEILALPGVTSAGSSYAFHP